MTNEENIKKIKDIIYDKISENDVNGVRKILQEYPKLINAYINRYREGRGKTPLLAAIAEKDHNMVEMLKMLLEEFHADPNLRDEYSGFSPLFDLSYIEMVDKKEIVDLVLKRGADVNLASHAGKTPLMLAAQFGYVEQVKKLLDHGADATLKDRNNSNVFNWMAEYYGEENEEDIESIVKMLIDAGADINNINDFGYTAVGRLKEHKTEPIVEKVLVRYGAKSKSGT